MSSQEVTRLEVDDSRETPALDIPALEYGTREMAKNGEKAEILLTHPEETLIRGFAEKGTPRRFAHGGTVYHGDTECLHLAYPTDKGLTEFNREAVNKYFGIVNERKNQDHEDVLKNVKALNFSDIDVSLIENIQSVPIFVHAEGSGEVYEKVSEVYDKPYFERRKEMQELKSEFHSFIVNARIYGDESKLSGLNKTGFSDNFREIEKNKIGETDDDWYHEVTGFQVPDSKVGDRIL